MDPSVEKAKTLCTTQIASPTDHIPVSQFKSWNLWLIIFFTVFLFHFSGLNFLSPIIRFHPGNILSLKPPTRREFICDTTEKCELSVLGHQLSHFLGAAGFPQAFQGFIEVSTHSLVQNIQIWKKWLTLMNRNSGSHWNPDVFLPVWSEHCYRPLWLS